ncbi:MAG TPA: hypothetical protein DD381_07985 [Lentisphaeria bacterium]|nr:MAG: hypothetical protein A2X47_04550 [Lentisphaerae bacterium GWF2_38_69]HBM16261.1 hypothetical protein [Lentisphaeria bacterium]
MQKLKKLVILCGGTGGHFFPGLSIGRIFKAESGEVILITGRHKVSYAKEFSPKYNIPIYEVESSSISASPLKLINFIIKTSFGFFQSWKILVKHKPDAVLAMGSYTSIPSSLAAIVLRIPLFLHDGNSVIGKANCFLSKWAKILMSAFPVVNQNLDISKILVTGMPLRPELADTKIKDKQEAIALFNKIFIRNFDIKKITLLIFGGSLGAKKINTSVPEALASLNLTANSLQVVHLTGRDYAESTSERYKQLQFDHLILEKYDDMSLLYKMADIVICRSGGSTVAELHYFDKNSILVPYPLAAENHQYFNALFLQMKNPDTLIIEDKDCSVETLAKAISNLLTKTPRLQTPKTNPAVSVLSVIEEKLI